MTRSWLVIAALVLLPLAVYWPTVSHEYGFRDDYAHLREVRDKPGWLEELTASYGRPVYGYVLEASLQPVHTVADLSALRLAAALVIAAVGLLQWWHLRRSGWSELEAAAIGAATTLLPGAQILVAWSIAWPITLGLAAAVAGFALVDRGLERTGLHRTGLVFAGSIFYFIAGLTYQTTGLFAVMMLAAVLLMRKDVSMRDDVRWVVTHIGLLFVSLVSGWLIMNIVFSYGGVPEQAQLHFGSDPLNKLLWFVRNPLPNSLALFALRDSVATPPTFFFALAAIIAIILMGFVYVARKPAQRRRWLFAALVLPFVAHSVSLAANSQAIGYRTLLPLSGLFLILAMFGLRAIMAQLNLRQAARVSIYGSILISVAWLAQHNAYTLIAEPQAREWQIMQAAAANLRFDADTQVFLVTPMIKDRSTARVYADEFGSLSSDAEWAAEEMFKTALRQRFPTGLPKGVHYALDTGLTPPALHYDFIVDLRRLKGRGSTGSRHKRTHVPAPSLSGANLAALAFPVFRLFRVNDNELSGTIRHMIMIGGRCWY